MRWMYSILKFLDFRNQIKKKLIFSYIVILIPAILLPAYLYYNKSVETVENVLKQDKFEATSIVNSNIESYINEIEKITQAPNYSTEMRQTLQSLKYKVGIIRQEAEEKLFNTVDVLIGLRSDIVGIYIFDDTNNKYYKTSRSDITPFYSFVDQPSFQKMKELKGERVIIPTHKADYYVTQSPRYIWSIGRSILSKDKQEEIGVIYVDLDLEALQKIVSPLQNENNRFFILDGDKRLVYGNDQDQLGEPFKADWLPSELAKDRTDTVIQIDGHRKLVTSFYSQAVGWWYITETDIDPLLKPSTDAIKNAVILISICSLCILLMISFALSSSITSPIKQLYKAMRNMGNENFKLVEGIKTKDEIGSLVHAYNEMIGQISELINTVYKVSIKEKEAQLTALQSQINPHFLYNTLNSISCMAEIKGVHEISLICTAVSDIFRYSIKSGSELVPLSEEIENIKNYMTIQRIRFENRIEAVFQVDDELLNYRVIKFSLQPIVENAIYHGLEPKVGKGMMIVSVQKETDHLIIKVFDNGVGIQEEKVHALSLALNGDYEMAANEKNTGIGITNVNDRIRLRFGSTYGVKLQSKLGSGTSVQIKLPIINS